MATIIGEDGIERCAWAGDAKELADYHDAEWGLPVGDDQRLFEKLCLESFQSGLSWRTILNKRPAFREAFAGFEVATVAQFDDGDVERLLADASIVRNRQKIEATINNARRTVELQATGDTLARLLWSFEPSATELGEPQTMTTSPSSVALAKDLRRRGWKFLGPTTLFSFMQAMGLLNDHAVGCFRRDAIDTARANFQRP